MDLILRFKISLCLLSVVCSDICKPRFDKDLYNKGIPSHWYWPCIWKLCENVTVCYNEPEPLGCFSQGPQTAFCHQIFPPDSPKNIAPEFWMFTPEKGSNVNQRIDFLNHNLKKTLTALSYNKIHDLWVLVHGFGATWPMVSMFHMKDALIAKGHNVLICRWSKGSKGPNYLQAVANTRVMGAIVARILKVMQSINGITLSSTTIVGFSLGAHVAGSAGTILGKDLKKIIGLDPAGPLFSGEKIESRLDPTDAGFVQCIHTNGEPFECGGLGTMQPMGHIDFYANGGKIQPPCIPGTEQAIIEILHFNMSAVVCSHCRAPYLFTNSVLLAGLPQPACKFDSFKCATDEDWETGRCFTCGATGCPVVGYETDVGSKYSGLFFFGTRPGNNSVMPFCGNVFKTLLQSDKNAQGSISIHLTFDDGYTSEELVFQSTDDTLLANSPTARILVTKYTASKVTSMTLTYLKHKEWVFPDGTDHFKLTTIAVAENGEQGTHADPVDVRDKIPVCDPH